MNVILQVSTGLFDRCTAESVPAVRQRLEDLFRRLPVRGVIYGWGRKEGLFENILDVTCRHGAEAWLWIPVFADIRNPEDADPMVFWGTEGEKAIRACAGEEFHFVCPLSERNRNSVFSAWEELSEGCVPDGVFLDRIRYPSAVYAPAHFFGCRCAVCQEKLKAAGMDPQRFARRAGPARSLDEYLPDAMENGRYHYGDRDPECLTAMNHCYSTMGYFGISPATDHF